jgi:hypothetical protein
LASYSERLRSRDGMGPSRGGMGPKVSPDGGRAILTMVDAVAILDGEY